MMIYCSPSVYVCLCMSPSYHNKRIKDSCESIHGRDFEACDGCNVSSSKEGDITKEDLHTPISIVHVCVHRERYNVNMHSHRIDKNEDLEEIMIHLYLSFLSLFYATEYSVYRE